MNTKRAMLAPVNLSKPAVCKPPAGTKELLPTSPLSKQPCPGQLQRVAPSHAVEKEGNNGYLLYSTYRQLYRSKHFSAGDVMVVLKVRFWRGLVACMLCEPPGYTQNVFALRILFCSSCLSANSTLGVNESENA